MTDQTVTAFNGPSNRASHVNELTYVLRRTLARLRTTTLCEITTVTNNGGVSPVGTLTVQPLVQQTDGAGNVTSLPLLYGVPYLRVQGGTNAIIMDPQVGDIGYIGFADRDISAVLAAQQQSPPGSNRRHSLADAVWIGGTLGKANPTQYIQFNASGVTIMTPNALLMEGNSGGGSNVAKITMNSSGIVLSFGGKTLTINASGFAFAGGPVTGDNAATFQGEGTFNGGHTVSAHHHPVTGISTGSATVQSQPPAG